MRRHFAGPGIGGDAAPGQDLGQAPVHHLHLAEAAHHHVGGLEVAVDHPAGVRVSDRLCHREERGQQARAVLRRVGPLGQQVGQGPALDQLHGEVGAAVGEGPQLVDRDNAGVLELAADLRLLDEAVDHLGAVAMGLEQDLDGEVASQVGVASLEDRPHAAAGDLAQKLEPRGAIGRFGQLGGAGPDQRRLRPGVGVAEQHPGQRAHRRGQGGQGTGPSRSDRKARRSVGHPFAGEPRRGSAQASLEQTAGAKPRGRMGRKGHTADRAKFGRCHRRTSPGDGNTGMSPTPL